MIAIDTNILVGSIQTFDPALRNTARHRVSRIQVHDARIVAAMGAHQVSKILTFDLNDFNRYENITVIHPSTL